MKTRTFLLSLASLTLFPAPSRAQIITENFNSYDSVTGGAAPLDANWNLTQNPSNVIGLANTGLSGTQAVDFTAPGQGETSLINKQAFDIGGAAAGTVFQFKGYFKCEALQNNGNANPGFSFRTDNTGVATSNFHIMGRVNGAGGLNILSNGGGLGTSSANGLVSAGNWYFLDFRLTKLETTNQFDAVVNLYSSDSDGVVSGASLGTSFANGITNADLWTCATAYAAIRNGPHTSGLSRAGIIDNLSFGTAVTVVVPPTITSFSTSGTDATLTYTSMIGSSYTISSSLDLSVWTQIDSFTANAISTTRTVIDANLTPAPGKVFYRVGYQP